MYVCECVCKGKAGHFSTVATPAEGIKSFCIYFAVGLQYSFALPTRCPVPTRPLLLFPLHILVVLAFFLTYV